MSDEHSNGDDTGETLQADAGQSPQYVTEQAMQENFKSLQDGLFSTMRKMLTQKPAAQQKEAPSKSETPQNQDAQTLADMQAQIDFLRGAPQGLTQDAQDAMFDLYKAQKPDDPAEWFESTSRLFATAPIAPEVKQQETQTQQTQHPPASNSGAPKATSAGEVDANDVTKWSQEDYNRQFSLKAPVPHNRYDIRNREFYREIRRSAERKMAQTKISLGGRKDR